MRDPGHADSYRQLRVQYIDHHNPDLILLDALGWHGAAKALGLAHATARTVLRVQELEEAVPLLFVGGYVKLVGVVGRQLQHVRHTGLQDGEDDQEGDSHYIQEAEGKNEYKFYSYFHEHSDLFYGYHYMDYGGYRLRGFHGHQTEGTHPDLHQHHHNKPDNDNYMYGYYGYYYAYQDFN